MEWKLKLPTDPFCSTTKSLIFLLIFTKPQTTVGLHMFSKSPYSVLTTLGTSLYFIYWFLELSALHCYSYGGILVRKWGKHTNHVHYSRYFFWQWDVHTVWLIYFCHSKGNSPSSTVAYIDPELLSSKVPSASWIKKS